MRHVYIVLAHKAPEQLARLVDRLHGPGCSFVVHVDRRSPPPVHAGARALLERPNVTVLPARRTPWPGFGHLGATLDALAAIERDATRPDYVSLLTGQDYPVKAPEAIEARLSAAGGASFLQHFPLPRRPGGRHAGAVDESGWPHGGLDRIRTWNFEVAGRELRLPPRRPALPVRRRLPAGMRPFGGSGYWTLSAAALREVHRAVRDRPDLVRFFRRVYLPHEMFFQTVLAGASAPGPIVNDDLRYIDWSAGGSHPELLCVADLPALARTDALFARKFDAAHDAEVLDLIDRGLLGR